jgi:hypothetical protein
MLDMLTRQVHIPSIPVSPIYKEQYSDPIPKIRDLKKDKDTVNNEIFSHHHRFRYTCEKQQLMQQNRLTHIDGLRGLAALVVMVSHFLCTFYPAFQTIDAVDVQTRSGIELFITATPFNFWYNGNFAVCIFFVISGYVLSYSYFQNRGHGIYLLLGIPQVFQTYHSCIVYIGSVFCLHEVEPVSHNRNSSGNAFEMACRQVQLHT